MTLKNISCSNNGYDRYDGHEYHSQDQLKQADVFQGEITTLLTISKASRCLGWSRIKGASLKTKSSSGNSVGSARQIKYTGFRDRPHEERQARFHTACRDGRSEIAFVATGTNLSLQFFPANLHGEQRQTPTREYVDFDRETGKVILTSLSFLFSLILSSLFSSL
ncbi:unnamed protein product [Oncorhynchus mykiss]|uniref:Uncharacterized protein n=1 Tax=Oncorhynchus mykiss TaxID=8022 RepID=A0A060YA77_ONCMY|nr:unnamed protein product [Oncorhynchus mykiss]